MSRPTDYTVYRLTNLANGKVYFGITKRGVEKRMAQHKAEARRGSSLLISRAIAKYGWQSFSVSVEFFGLTQDQACKAEIELIAKHESTGVAGYNMSSGGQAGVSDRPETKERKSLAAKKAWAQSTVWQNSIYSPSRLEKIAEKSAQMHKDASYRKSFINRHDVMVKAARNPECRKRAVVSFISNGHSVSVECANGMKFETAANAARWVAETTKFKAAAYTNILKAARGKRPTAYGLKWKVCEIPDMGIAS
jgi:group I intron endonuclease